jgi:hypothetical protein
MAAVIVLLSISSAITLLGVAFGVYAVLNNVAFSVMSAQIPGVIFAAVVVFLGVRYFLASLRLRDKIRGMKFSWKNFRKQVNTGSPKSRKASWGDNTGSPKSRKASWGDNEGNVKGEA